MQERHLAARIVEERTRREWTYDGLARRMTDAGCPIRGSAIYKIENHDRRITVAELVALSLVFEEPLQDLLVPASLAADQRARGLCQRLISSMDQVEAADGELWSHIRRHPAAAEAVRQSLRDSWVKLHGDHGAELWAQHEQPHFEERLKRLTSTDG